MNPIVSLNPGNDFINRLPNDELGTHIQVDGESNRKNKLFKFLLGGKQHELILYPLLLTISFSKDSKISPAKLWLKTYDYDAAKHIFENIKISLLEDFDECDVAMAFIHFAITEFWKDSAIGAAINLGLNEQEINHYQKELDYKMEEYVSMMKKGL